MQNIELKNIHQHIQELVTDTGKFIRNEGLNFDMDVVETKSFNQLVSYVDKTAEEKLVKGLLHILPEAGFITEEKTINLKGDRYNFVIDPLDGTTNFCHGLPVFSVSVGLLDGDELVAGYVYDVCQDWLFHGYQGGQAMLNNELMKVSKTKTMEGSLMATGFPYYDFVQMPQYIEVLKVLMKETHGLRRMGSAAIDLVYTACGKFDGFFEYGLQPWDVAAGAFLVKLAGGKVADFKGGEDYLFGKTIIAGNPEIFDSLTKLIEEKFER